MFDWNTITVCEHNLNYTRYNHSIIYGIMQFWAVPPHSAQQRASQFCNEHLLPNKTPMSPFFLWNTNITHIKPILNIRFPFILNIPPLLNVSIVRIYILTDCILMTKSPNIKKGNEPLFPVYPSIIIFTKKNAYSL